MKKITLAIVIVLMLFATLSDLLSQRIISGEYYFDSDPGIGNAIQFTISNPGDTVEYIKDIDISNLDYGMHYFCIRYRDSIGKWSHTDCRYFIIHDNSTFSVNEDKPYPIIKAEYYIDHDPGLGNASQITFDDYSDSQVFIDSLEVQEIGYGIHYFCIRYQDSLGKWSHTDCRYFFVQDLDKFMVIEAPPAPIKKAEYFFEDHGPGNASQVSTQIADTVEFNEDIDLSNFILCKPLVTVRYQDTLGRWSMNFSKTFTIEDWESTKEFDYIRFGNNVSFLPPEYYKSTYQWDFGDGTVDSVPFSKHYYEEPGEYEVTMIASNNCGVDTTVKTISITGIQDYTPKSGGNTGQVTMFIYGAGFTDSTEVKLTKEGEKEITPDSKKVISNKILSMIFDLNASNVGGWDLVVDFPYDTTFTFQEGFFIEKGVNPIPWMDISGRTATRPDTKHELTIEIGNNGNIDAIAIPVWIAVPEDTEIDFNFNVVEITDSTLNYLGSKFDKDSIPDYILVDSIFTTDINKIKSDIILENLYGAKIYSFLINASKSFTSTYKFYVKYHNLGNRKLKYWISNPLYEKKWTAEVFDRTIDLTYRYFNLIPQKDPNLEIALIASKLVLAPAFYNLLIFVNGYDERAKWYFNKHFSVDNFISDSYLILEPYLDKLKMQLPEYQYNPEFYVETALKKLTDLRSLALDSRELYDIISSGEINEKEIRVVNSIDPNEKVGPGSANENNFIQSRTNFPYTVFFENVDTATAPAQEIFITDTLDSEMFDLSTFQLLSINFGEITINVPTGLREYTRDIDMLDEKGIYVRCNTKLDTTTGVVFWHLLSIDPKTHMLPDDPLVGFLPPNSDPPEGEGYVSYSIYPKNNLKSGDTLKNKASIIFDVNEPIITNEWINIIDNDKPSSSITNLEPTQSSLTFTVNWEGDDITSEIEYFNIYYNVNNSSTFTLWKYRTTETQSDFVGLPDSTYGFYSIAVDYAGNIEESKSIADASTKIILSNVEETLLAENNISIYPNPSDNQVTISYFVPKPEQIQIEIFNQYGIKVDELVDEYQLVGRKSIVWFPKNEVTSGIYFFRIKYGASIIVKKVSIIK